MKEWALPTARGTLRWSGTGVMGILNVTPDSFSDGGSYVATSVAIERGLSMLNQGAVIIDVGGESTRPGAASVPEEVELERVLPVIRGLAAMGVPTSIDTLKPEVARAALSAGAWLLNDVSGLRNPAMLQVCVEAGAPAVISHMQGEPRTMQKRPQYRDVLTEVETELSLRRDQALAAGLPEVLLDPGIGFGKELGHNLELLRNLSRLARLGRPLLVGASRKGMLGQLTGETSAAARDPGSLAVHLYAARQGAALVRVHDVAGHVQGLQVQAALEGWAP